VAARDTRTRGLAVLLSSPPRSPTGRFYPAAGGTPSDGCGACAIAGHTCPAASVPPGLADDFSPHHRHRHPGLWMASIVLSEGGLRQRSMSRFIGLRRPPRRIRPRAASCARGLSIRRMGTCRDRSPHRACECPCRILGKLCAFPSAHSRLNPTGATGRGRARTESAAVERGRPRTSSAPRRAAVDQLAVDPLAH